MMTSIAILPECSPQEIWSAPNPSRPSTRALQGSRTTTGRPCISTQQCWQQGKGMRTFLTAMAVSPKNPLTTLQVGRQSGWMQSYVHQDGLPETPIFLKESYMYQYLPRMTSLEIAGLQDSSIGPLVPPFIPAIRFTNCDRILPMISYATAIVTWWHVLLFVAINHQIHSCAQHWIWPKNSKHLYSTYYIHNS